MTQYFPSKKGFGLGYIILGILISIIAFCYYAIFYKGFDLYGFLVVTGVLLPLVLGTYIVWFRSGYYVNDKTLTIKIGFYTQLRILHTDIISIKRSRTNLDAPANALRRIKITYMGGEIYISAAREEEFLNLMSNLIPPKEPRD